MWEDDRNKCGGRWLVNVDKKGPRPTIIDQYWVETVSGWSDTTYAVGCDVMSFIKH